MRTIAFGAALCSALALTACMSARFGDAAGARPVAQSGPIYNAPGAMEPIEPAPSGEVSSEPLPPPPGAAAADPGYPPPGGPIAADVPSSEPEPFRRSIQPGQQVAAASPSRSSVLGGWTAREASGSCRVHLASTPALDLYKASASGCANRDLGRITAWDFRDGEVFLYQPGGTVAARLRPGGGGMSGVLAKSGAPLTLMR